MFIMHGVEDPAVSILNVTQMCINMYEDNYMNHNCIVHIFCRELES